VPTYVVTSMKMNVFANQLQMAWNVPSFGDYLSAGLNFLGGSLELAGAYFSGGLLATTVGVDGAVRVGGSLAKMYALITGGRSAAAGLPTNLGGMIGAAAQGQFGGNLQNILQHADNIGILIAVGGPLGELSEVGSASNGWEIVQKVSSFGTETYDTNEELKETGAYDEIDNIIK
jgi:hypothetical protein